MTHPHDVTANVFTAAAAGETVPGFESVGSLLVDLGRVTPLQPGVALRAPAVAAATAASRDARRPPPTRWLRPATVAAIGAAGVAAIIVFGGSSSPTLLDIGPGGSPSAPLGGVERIVDDVDDHSSPDDPLEVTPSTSPATSTSGTSSPLLGSKPSAAGTGPSTTIATLDETTTSTPTGIGGEPTTTTSVAETTTSTTEPPSTSTVSTTTTTTTTTTEPQGNNGNGNGNGQGNGKGNQSGNGNGNGNGGPGGE